MKSKILLSLLLLSISSTSYSKTVPKLFYKNYSESINFWVLTQVNPESINVSYRDIKNIKKTITEMHNKFDKISIKEKYEEEMEISKGKLIEKKDIDSSGNSKGGVVFTYDNKNNLIEEVTYDSEEYIISKIINKYNDQGLIIESNDYWGNGDLKTKKIFNYDNKSNKVEMELYLIFTGDKSPSKYVYHYNEYGNITEINLGNADKSIYTYDSSRNIIESSFYLLDVGLINKTVCKYDNFNNIIESHSYKPNGVLEEKITYKYSYDAFKNWIKKERYEIGQLTRIEERKIDYVE